MTDPNAMMPEIPVEFPGDVVPGSDSLAAEAEPVTDSTTQSEIEKLKDQHLRLAAEFDNFRRRAARERQEAGWRAQGELVRSILDALDDLDRFAHVDVSTTDAQMVVEGVGMVERKIIKALSDLGFEVVNPVGEHFDPALHEALNVTSAASPEEDGVVAQCFQAGYTINGVVLRPARVIVKQWSEN